MSLLKKATPGEQLQELKRGVVDLISEAELLKKLEKSYESGKPLVVKLGADPTRPDLHLGHAVVINKLKQFQEFGHSVRFLIGDFTGMIGDPSGKNEARPPLTREEVQANSKTYEKQIFKILNPEQTQIVHNSAWLDKLTPADFIKIASQYTVARMLERDDFSKRYKGGTAIAIHEFLYPLMQGYDSVALKSDVELGGTDQLFNLLVGRDLQKSYNQAPQIVMTTPLLEGLDGVNKMSKSLDNYIGVEDSPRDMFGKTMRVSDQLMLRYYELVTDVPLAEIEKMRQAMTAGSVNPREFKVRLAKTIVTRFHGEAAGVAAVEEFDRIFVNKGVPDDMPEVTIALGRISGEQDIAALLKELGVSASTSEARRLIEGGGLEIGGEKVRALKADLAATLGLKSGRETVLKAGKKKFLKLKVT
ncbi:MAG: tyrosine--tRNA ligase [Bdellovibrionales bacterium]|jgi:tyrosyl-tRNA synthetase|nr:tyrosine--tRNA ligase [Bdellovibrionales bacterium]